MAASAQSAPGHAYNRTQSWPLHLVVSLRPTTLKPSAACCTQCTLYPTHLGHVVSTMPSVTQRTKAPVAVPVVLHCHQGELGEPALCRRLVEQQYHLSWPVEQSILFNVLAPVITTIHGAYNTLILTRHILQVALRMPLLSSSNSPSSLS